MPACNLDSTLNGEEVRDAVTGERELFEMVYRSMRSLAGSGALDLDDLVQAAAEQVTRGLPSFDRRSQLSTWVYGVCYRVLLGQRRWYRRWAARFSLSDEHPEPPTDDAHPLRLVEARERVRELHAALDQLSPKYRAVVMLHDIEERSVSEVAEIVGAGELTVRSRLRDGRKRLAQLLRERDAGTWLED